MPDFQRPDPGLLDQVALQPEDHAARVVAQRAHLVERRIVVLAHEVAVALQQRQFVAERAFDMPREILRQRRDGLEGGAKFVGQAHA